MEESIYSQIGGFVVVRKVVVEFYNNVLNEDELAKFFANTNMERQIDHQTKFISQLLGGCSLPYKSDSLKVEKMPYFKLKNYEKRKIYRDPDCRHTEAV